MLAASLIAAAAAAQQPPAAAAQQPPAAAPPGWQTTERYVTAGQDEPGYRAWYMAAPSRAVAVTSFNNYLTTYGVGGVVPTWQLLRTASMWHRCGAQPFEVPPVADWPNVVQTLRYVRDYVIPAVGPVEPVSVYRNPWLNQCAGGVAGSSHRHFQAIDLVPLRPTTREALMGRLCSAHLRRGDAYQVGLGFYAFLRFHVDTTRFRKWGAQAAGEAASCAAPLPRSAPPAEPVAATTVAGPASSLPESQPTPQ